MSLFKELKRRNVFKVAIAYIVVGWLLLQVAEIMVPALLLPEWVLSATAFFLMIGFLPAIIFAWAFEMTPEGLKRDHEVDRSASVTTSTGRKLDFIIIAVLVVAVALLLYERMGEDDSPGPAPTAQPDIETAAEPADPRISVAVLPFENLSTNEENAFFAAGVHEDIMTYLSRITELKVNSRTSVEPYADSDLSVGEIASALGATYIVEGSVRRAGNRVRVTAQLIDAGNDEHLWAENFDRELTDIFAIQTAVAKDIVAALHASLSPIEEELISVQPTDSIEAYDLFLKGRENMRSAVNISIYSPEGHALLEQAVAIDPDYAQAWAVLAISHGDHYWFGMNRTPERLVAMKEAVDRAFELQPNLPEAYLALSTYYYRGFYDYENALVNLEKARELIPNDADLYFNLGLTLRRLGRFPESVESFSKAVSLDRGHEEAWTEYYGTAASTFDYRATMQALESMPERFRSSGKMVGSEVIVTLAAEGDIDKARALLSTIPESDNYWYRWAKWNIAWYAREYQLAAELAIHPNFFNQLTPGFGYPEAAISLFTGGFDEEAKEMLNLGEEALLLELSRPASANYAWPHLGMARNLVQQGRFEEALASCDEVNRILPMERDAIHGAELAWGCAWVFARAGQLERGLDQLEKNLDFGYEFTPITLKTDPEWDFLRGNPRFESLANRPFEWGPE